MALLYSLSLTQFERKEKNRTGCGNALFLFGTA